MMIDWSTIIFQIINFIILVFLLRKFLYGPVVSVMEQREQEILEREANAQQNFEKGKQTTKDYQHRIEMFEDEKDEKTKQMHQEIKHEKQQLIEESREDVNQLQKKWKEDINQQATNQMKYLREQLSKHACNLAKKTLNDLADARLESIVLDVFTKKLKNLNKEELTKITEALKQENKAQLVSAFEISDQQKQSIEETLNQISDTSIGLDYAQNENLGCGYVLDFKGYKISWNINHYLDEIEKNILLELPKVSQDTHDESKS